MSFKEDPKTEPTQPN